MGAPDTNESLPVLPSETTAAHRLEVDGEVAKLDDLGPIVVTEDGKMRYISNWAEMTDEERETTQRVIARRNENRLRRLRGGFSSATTISTGSFVYGGFECVFRRKQAAPGFEGRPPLLLIHPVGIGLASWFWDRFLAEWSGAEVYVPDLIGCGSSEPWDPSQRGMHVPLDWERQLEALWRDHVRRPMIVVSQGGLAPLAIGLATRESELWRGRRAVRGVVLLSPPELDTLSKGLDELEVLRNFKLLGATLGSDSWMGRSAYSALCSRPFVRFFSDAFLFARSADEDFLDACGKEASAQRRWPVIAFNAGLVGMRPLHDQLRALSQPTLVLAGDADGKPLRSARRDYEAELPCCRLRRLEAARNVLPWERARATSKALQDFYDQCTGLGGVQWRGSSADEFRA